MSSWHRDDGKLHPVLRVMAWSGVCVGLMSCLAGLLVIGGGDALGAVGLLIIGLLMIYVSGYAAYTGREPRWLHWLWLQTWGRLLGERHPRRLHDGVGQSHSLSK